MASRRRIRSGLVNKRAESWWNVRDAMMNGELDLDGKDEKLLAQLGNQKYEINSRGRILMEDKRKSGQASPDRADAVTMLMRYSSRNAKPAAYTSGQHELLEVRF